ncbi:hypothetical protein [Pseudomonas sp. PS01303]|nr:hypothetical protein [Pseudomonas sp. PS01303]
MNLFTELARKIMTGNYATAQLLDKPTTVRVVTGHYPQAAPAINRRR